MGCGSCHFESRESSRACGEGIALKSHVPEHEGEEIAKRRVVLQVELQVLAVLESSPARRIGRFIFEWLLPFDMFEPKSTAVSFRPRRRRPHKSNTESLPSRAERLPVGYLSEGKHLAITGVHGRGVTRAGACFGVRERVDFN
jgi:hypothetical protein